MRERGDEVGIHYSTYYEYDGESRLTSVEYPDGTAVDYDYDRRSNIIGRTYYVDEGVVEELQSEYDDANRLVQMGDSDYNETG